MIVVNAIATYRWSAGARGDWSHLHADSRRGAVGEGPSSERRGPAGRSSRPAGRPLGPRPAGTGRPEGEDQGGVLQGAPQRRRAGLRLQGEESQVGAAVGGVK